MPPALRNHEPPPGRVEQKAVGPGQRARKAGLLTAREIDPPHRAAGVLCHEVDYPVRRTMVRGAVADEQGVGVGPCERGRAADPLGRRQGTTVVGAAPHDDAPVVEPRGQSAIGRGGECGKRRVEASELLRSAALRGRESQDLRAARKEDAAAVEDEIVGRLGLERHLRLVERRVRSERAVHGRDGDGLAAQIVEDGLEPHGLGPQ